MKTTVLAAGAVVSMAGAARGQVIRWAAPTIGDWSVAANWSPMMVPNSPAHHVVLGLSGPYAVSVSGAVFAAGRYTATNPEVELRIAPPAGDAETGMLSMFGDLVNDGLIRLIADPGTDSNAMIQVNGDGHSLTGAGELRLEEARDTELYFVGAGDFTHGAGHVISGTGTITGASMTLINEGVILGNRPGGLDLHTRMNNRGLIRAVSPGSIRLSGSRITQTGPGLIEADGATITLRDAVWGGTMRSVNGGVFDIEPGTEGEVSEITLEGVWLIAPSPTVTFTRLIVRYSMTNNGLIRVSGRSSTTNNTRVQILAEDSTIRGTGEIRLEETGDTEILLDDGAGWIANGEGHTISGVGMIHGVGAEFRNAGILSPGVPLGSLRLANRTVMQPTSVVRIELGGDAASLRDDLDGTGSGITLGGTLKVEFRDGYSLPACSEVVVVRGNLTGVFATHDLPAMPLGLIHVRYGPATVTIGYIPGDLDGDGLLDFADYLQFLNLFDAQDPRADLNGDGIVDFADFLEFLNLYDAGC